MISLKALAIAAVLAAVVTPAKADENYICHAADGTLARVTIIDDAKAASYGMSRLWISVDGLKTWASDYVNYPYPMLVFNNGIFGRPAYDVYKLTYLKMQYACDPL